jgi:hypothetical protein
MQMNRNAVYAISSILCVVDMSAAAKPTLCQADEDVLFSCNASKKLISVCASRDLEADHGYLQYRFGSPGKVELAIPSDKSTLPANSASSGTMMFSGGGGAYLRFTAGDFNYAVYTAIGKGWGEKDGVAIEHSGKRIAHVSCTDEPVSKLGDELFQKAGLKPEDTDFDLP